MRRKAFYMTANGGSKNVVVGKISANCEAVSAGAPRAQLKLYSTSFSERLKKDSAFRVVISAISAALIW